MKLSKLFQTYRRERSVTRLGVRAVGLCPGDSADREIFRLFERPDRSIDVFMTWKLPAGCRIWAGGVEFDFSARMFDSPDQPYAYPLMTPVCGDREPPELTFVGRLGADGAFEPARGWYAYARRPLAVAS